ncbi:MAG: TonB-dependent receptor [Prevotellaceae bacterium]|nr:TonB-dependent receptor [Prevotellaceae bacterium]
MKSTTLFLIGVLFVSSLRAQSAYLSGFMRGEDNEEPLIGVNVYSPTVRRGVVSDDKGFYRLSLPVGRPVSVRFSYVGTASQSLQFVLTKDTVIHIRLQSANSLPTLTVYAPHRNFGIDDSQMSAIELPMAQVKSMPALFGELDVMKALQRLPGVQAVSDGHAGLFVRGGNYDQNLIILDGSTLYNSEHLNGFVSALNADMIENILFYKGAFPARYGARLSSVLDIGMKEGDFEQYHGSADVGMLASRIQIEGPIWKGKTSFNVGARASYFNAIVMPLLKKVYDKPETLQPYARMNYWDVTAKVVHRFSDKDKLSAMFYKGHDVNDTAPTDSEQQYQDEKKEYSYDNRTSNYTDNSWGNMVASLFWTHRRDERLSLNTNLSYSQYRYDRKMGSEITEQKDNITQNRLERLYRENSYAAYHSGIDDVSLTADVRYQPSARHDIRGGGKLTLQQLTPTVNAYKRAYTKEWTGMEYSEETSLLDVTSGKQQQMQTAALYVEDDWTMHPRWKANVGLRYTSFFVKGKTYQSLEPRLALRWMFAPNMAWKASYSGMAQGIHLLSSSNLVMPSDLWVTITQNTPLMKAHQWAVGYNWQITPSTLFSVEGYYKTMDNVLEYREGSSYINVNADWENMAVTGEGRTYGIELLLQKKVGKATGWIGYTWSKSLRTFNRPGQELNGGNEFYAGNDRRNNLNLVFSYRFNEHWEASAAWTYQTGRRGTLATTHLFGGMPNESDSYMSAIASSNLDWEHMYSEGYNDVTSFQRYFRFYSYHERNGYKLPDVHRLDVAVNYSFKHPVGESKIGLSIYNLYNRKNIANVYIGYENVSLTYENRTAAVLKGICPFPFMPSFNYTFKF